MRVLPAVFAATAAIAATSTVVGCLRAEENDLPFCEETTAVIGLDDATSLGFTASALVDLAVSPSPFQDILTYHRGGQTPLIVTLHAVAEARFVDSEAVYPKDGITPTIAIACQDRLEVDARATLITDDGAFNEDVDVVLRSSSADAVAMAASLDPFELQGSYDVNVDLDELGAIDPADIESITLAVEAAFDVDGSHGTVHAIVTGRETCGGDECTAFAANVDVGSWDASTSLVP
jgi:hypothetical protein